MNLSFSLPSKPNNRKPLALENFSEEDKPIIEDPETQQHHHLSRIMKLSFSLPSKSSSKSNSHKPSQNFSLGDKPRDEVRETQHEFVTEFDPSKTLTDRQPKHVIPRLENTWKPFKKMRNLDLPLQSSTEDPDLRFELEVPPDTDSAMSYGLNLRSKDDGKKSDDLPEDRSGLPGSIESLMLQKFKEDMKNLPEDRGFDEFVDVPVEGFGARLLSSYGWSEGKGIGRNAKEDVKVVQYVRRSGREGLGFEPQTNGTKQKGNNSRPQLVAPKGPDGRTRHVVGIDEKLVERELKGIHVGKIVRVVGGRHVGLKGKVLEKLGGDSEYSAMVVLKLSRSEEEVRVGVDEVVELGSVEEEKFLRKIQESKYDRQKDGRRDSLSRVDQEKRNGGKNDRKGNKEERRRGDERRHKEEERKTVVSWLRSHIRVRIISKDFKGGKLYLKKGEVVDVVGPSTCDITMDESKELVQSVNQDMLETALPRRGGQVLVLYGEHKGVFGNLVERDMEKEIGVVRDADSHALLNVRLEQIAEYIGDPSYIGY